MVYYQVGLGVCFGYVGDECVYLCGYVSFVVGSDGFGVQFFVVLVVYVDGNVCVQCCQCFGYGVV